MTIYKLYRKIEGVESTELGWEFIITGKRELSFVKPGSDETEIYSHYDIEIFCLCEHGTLEYTTFQNFFNVEDELDCKYGLLAVSDAFNVLFSAVREIAVQEHNNNEKAVTENEC